MTGFLPSEGRTGATNTPDPSPSAPEGVRVARDEMVAEVARALGYAGVSPFEIEDWRIADFADRLHRAGYRRVVEDDDTIERTAKALAAFDGYVWSEDDGASDNVANPDYYLRRARVVVRALREDT